MHSLQSFKVKNLFSYDEAEFQIINNELTLIYGINKDNPGRSNGSGKSSILDCISLLVTGSPLKKLKKEDLIRNDQSTGYLEGILTNPVLNSELKICRYFHQSKTNKIEIYENGILNTQLKDLNPKESEKYITELIGISETDLLNYFLISKEKYESLFISNDSTKKSIINRFSKADSIDYIEPLLKIEIDKHEKSIIKIDQDIVGYNSKIELLQTQIDAEEKIDVEEDRKKDIESIELLILKCVEEQKRIDEQRVELVDLRDSDSETLSQIDDSKEVDRQVVIKTELYSIEEQVKLKREEYLEVPKKHNKTIDHRQEVIESYKSDLLKLKEELKESDQFIGEIEKNLADSIECPKCLHKFILRDKEYNIEEATVMLPEVKKIKEETEKKIKTFTELMDETEKEIQEVKKIITTEQTEIEKEGVVLKKSFTEKENELKLIDKEISEISLKKEKLLNQIRSYDIKEKSLSDSFKFQEDQEKKYQQGIIDLKEKVYEKKTENLKVQIEQYRDQIQLQDEVKNEVQLELAKYLKWQSHFKRFKSFLANKSIRLIQDYSNHFLELMKSDLKVSVDGFKELASGKLKEEITIMVSRDGLNNENFSKFSGGQKAEVDLSCILSMQKIINMTVDYGKGLNLLCIDEVLESLDSVGLENIVKAFKGVGQTLLMITHVDPDKSFDCNKIVVEYENKISKVKS